MAEHEGSSSDESSRASPEAVVDSMTGSVPMVLRFVARSARAARLSSTDFMALVCLTSTGGMTGVELAGALGITSSSITELGDRLERKGMVSRTRPRDNRRVILLRSTARGRRAIDRELAPLCAKLQELVTELTDRDRRVLARLVQDVRDSVDQAD